MKLKSLIASAAYATLGVLAAGTASAANEFAVDTAHSQVLFEVAHLGISRVTGQFDDFEVSLNFDPEDLSTLNAETVIQMASVDTREQDRDKHLRSADFFDVASHPTMRFVSQRTEVVSNGKLRLHGQLTIRGTTRPVTLDVNYGGLVRGPRGNQIAVFRASTTINRKDFGVSWNKVLDTGGLVVGEMVAIEIQLEASRAAATSQE